MDLQLAGRTALVTGASSGIGVGIARLLAREGVRVCVHGRNQAGIDRTVAAIAGEGGQAVGVAGDLGDPAGAASVAEAALAALDGRVDILVANAGGSVRQDAGGWADVEPEEWVGTFQLNVASTVQLTKALVPAMQEAGFGRIIVISSINGLSPEPNSPDYSASKAALLNMVAGGAKWLMASGVTINAVSPGAVRTEGLLGYVTQMAEQLGWEGEIDELERRAVEEMFHIPVGRMARIDEIAATVALLASPLGGFYQGSNLRIDGGALGTIGG
jgi:3-oxoacyl-[acyl-carrier protein] reductase